MSHDCDRGYHSHVIKPNDLQYGTKFFEEPIQLTKRILFALDLNVPNHIVIFIADKRKKNIYEETINDIIKINTQLIGKGGEAEKSLSTPRIKR